jgi:hypothetical protein
MGEEKCKRCEEERISRTVMGNGRSCLYRVYCAKDPVLVTGSNTVHDDRVLHMSGPVAKSRYNNTT